MCSRVSRSSAVKRALPAFQACDHAHLRTTFRPERLTKHKSAASDVIRCPLTLLALFSGFPRVLRKMCALFSLCSGSLTSNIFIDFYLDCISTSSAWRRRPTINIPDSVTFFPVFQFLKIFAMAVGEGTEWTDARIR